MSSAEYYLDGPPGSVEEKQLSERQATPQPQHSLETTPRAARVGSGGMRDGGARRTNRFPLERQYAESGTSTPERRSSETGDELAAILGRRSRTSTASSISSTTLAAERYGREASSDCTSCGLPATAAAAATLPPPIPIPKRRDEQCSPVASSPAAAGLPPPLPSTPTSRHSANCSPHLEHSPHSGQLQRANRPSPILVKEKELPQLQQPAAGSYGSKLVPGDDGDNEAVAGRAMASSPPPYKRRTSCASTASDITSSTLPLSASYQCLLLSPLWTTAVMRHGSYGGSATNYNSDDYSLSAREQLPPRPKSAQELRPPRDLMRMRMRMGSSGRSTPGECICVPPVLLSPVLSRPVRSASAASSPLPGRNQVGSDSDGDLNIVWRLPQNRRSMDRPGSRTNTPTLSPILNRSSSASKLAASFAANRSSSGSGLLSTRVLLRRTDSDAADARRRRKGKRRPSFMSHGMCSETSMDSCSSSTSNLTKMRLSLGHSDPQISASSLHCAAAGAVSAAGPSTSSTAGAGGAATTALPAVRMRVSPD